MKKYYLEKLYQLLALEYNCSPDDFKSSENIITESAKKNGARNYSPEKPFFHMVTLGGNAVITADTCLHRFFEGYIKDKAGPWLFEREKQQCINDVLGDYGYTLTDTFHMFLPKADVAPQNNYAVKWFYGDDIHKFYGDERFPNAILKEFDPQRPDKMVVCAYDGENIMGMAGCSEDAPGWMQIGIDVMPQYRSMGVGTYLVTILKNKITEMGDVPFYGTSLSNYHSWNIAINSGFYPAWVELGSKKI